MRKGPLAVFLAVLCVAAVPVVAYLLKPREVISSTPSAYTGLTVPLPLPAKAEACDDEILFDTDSRIARFGVSSAQGRTAPDLAIQARGNASGPYRNGYRSATFHLPGGWSGTRQLDVPLRPPHTAVFGELCIRNLGEAPVDLVGAQDGRAFSRPTVSIDGQPQSLELQLRLMETGKHSILSRLGAVTAHASTLKPFGAWWMWVLALALLALAPLGVLAAVRAGLADEGEAPALPGWAFALGACGLAVLWLFYWSVNTHVFQNDEDQYVYLSRWLLDNLPGGLWDFATYGRGLQRLEVWMLAVPAALFHDPYSLGLGRLLNTVAFVSTAIPVYLLARGNGLSSRWAALPAVLSGVVPWAVVTTAFLTENLAYPAFAWVVYGVWRAALKPGVKSDLLAIALIFVAGLARSALLALAPVLPLTILAVELRCGGSWRGALRRHALLWGAIVLAALLVLIGLGPFGGLFSRLAGGYGTHFSFSFWGLAEKSGRFFARIVIGTGFLPAAIGLPWLARTVARSREPGPFALASASLLSALVLFYTLNTAGYDERYIVYLAPLVLLPAALAIGRRELSGAGIAVASVLLAVLLLRVPWNGNQGSFAFFVWPVETFYSHVFGFDLAKVLPGGEQDALKVAAVALGLIGVALGLVLRGRARWITPPVAAILIGAVALSIVADTQYSLSKHVNGVGSKSGPGLRARSFADAGVPGGSGIGEWAVGVGERPDFYGVWREVQFYNQRVDTVVSLGGAEVIVPPGDTFFNGIAVDPGSGRVTTPKPLPGYLVVPTQAEGPHLRGTILAAPSYIPVALIKRADPPSVAWDASGFNLDGSVADQAKGATIRIYPGGATCASVDLTAPAERGVSWSLGDRSGKLAPAKPGTVKVPLAGGEHVDVRLRGGAHLLNVRLGC